MKIRTILAAAAAPAALAAVLLGTAGQASAATTTSTVKATGSTVCNQSTTPDNPQRLGGLITSNVDVPAGHYCHIEWGEVAGNVSVEGVLWTSATVFDKNVSVSGPGSQLWFGNYPSHIKGNMSVTGSSGAFMGNSDGTSFGDNTGLNTDQNTGITTSWPGPDAATANGSQIDGNFSFTDNTGRLYVGSPLHVGGKFTLSGNGPYNNPAAAIDYSNLTASGGTSIS